MSTPNRNNGLSAERYTPLVDLEPHFADALLDALRDEGVAAYATPAPGVRGPYMDTQLPNTPTDRVWVDAGATIAARSVLDARRGEFSSDDTAAPELVTAAAPPEEPAVDPITADLDLDAAWRAIVAGYGSTGTDPVPRWSATEDVEPEAEAPSTSSYRILRRPEPTADEDWGLPAPESVPRPAEEPEEHYVPPPPPPLPRVHPHTKLAWLGVVGGPLLLILFTALDWSPFYGASVLAIAAFVGGFAALVYRMKDDDPDLGGDNGAVV